MANNTGHNSFTYRPASLRSPETWTLDGPFLTGPPGQFDLRQTQSICLVDQTIRTTHLRRLDLKGPWGTVRLALTLPRSARKHRVPEAQSHLALLREVAKALSQHSPQDSFTFGEGPGIRWVYFLTGLTALAFGLGIAGLAIFTGLSGDRMAAAALPMILLLALGLSTMSGNIPWHPPLSLPLTLLDQTLLSLSPTSS